MSPSLYSPGGSGIWKQQLGVTLLIRTSRGMRPTPAGEALFEHVKVMLSGFEKATARVKQIAAGRAGFLRVGTVATELHFPKLALARLREVAPDVDLRLSVMRSHELLS